MPVPETTMFGSRDQDKPSEDDLATAAAIGSLAYLSADIAHHALGHAAACLAFGGSIRSLSSIFVNCTLTGAAVDLSGPAANLLLGALAAVVTMAFRRLSRHLGLFLLLVAAFNLFWFSMQMVCCVATKADDWAWPMHEYKVRLPLRIALVVCGAVAYHFTTRFVGARLGTSDRKHARRIANSAWLAAGAVACLMAALDHHPLSAIALHAAPQSLAFSIGLLFAPRSAVQRQPPLRPISRSLPWIASAIVATILSMVFLGPGVRIALN
jgi:hypothetical protein